MKRIIITGSNKGIGFGILKALSSKPFEIIMACRNLQLAKNAISSKLELQNQKKIIPMELDLNFPESIANFSKDIKKQFDKIDILVNNAGIKSKEAFNEKTAKQVFRTNFFGTVELTEQLLPSIKDQGKIVIVGSTMGKYKLALKSEDLKKQFDAYKTNEEMYQLIEKYFESIKKNTVEKDGWTKQSYSMSKMCIDVYAQNLGQRVIPRNIQVYAVCPGNTKTDCYLIDLLNFGQQEDLMLASLLIRQQIHLYTQQICLKF